METFPTRPRLSPIVKSPKSLLVVLLALTTVGGAVLAWNQYQELIRLRGVALEGDERAGLQKRLWDAEKRAKDLADKLAATRSRTGDDETAGSGDAAAGDASDENARNNRRQRGGPGGPGGFSNFATLMQKPEIQKLLAIQQKVQLDSRYATLFKNLNLTPGQLDKFKNLLVERQASMMDVMSAAREQGIDPRKDPAGYRSLIASTQADIDSSIKTAIGDDAFGQYKNYDQTERQRGTVDQLQQSLSYGSTPLTSEQSAKMVQILTQTGPQRTNAATAAAGQPSVAVAVEVNGGGGGGGMRFGFGGPQSSTITNEAVTLAQGVLTAPQLAAFQQLQQAQLAQQKVDQLLRQSGEAAQGTVAPTGATAPTRKNGKTGKTGG